MFVQLIIHLSFTHDVVDAVDFDKSGSNDASHHRTLAFSNSIDNVTVNG